MYFAFITKAVPLGYTVVSKLSHPKPTFSYLFTYLAYTFSEINYFAAFVERRDIPEIKPKEFTA